MRKNTILWLLTIVLLTTGFANAQQTKNAPRVGFIGASSATTAAPYLEAFRQGLRDLHYVEGENIAIEVRWADGSAQRFPQLIAELVGLKIDILLVSAAAGALAAKNAGTATPVVFAAVTDPIGYGIIDSLARPGGNITGVALALGEGFSGKWVELLKEAAPRITKTAVLRNPGHPLADVFMKETQAAGRALKVATQIFDARDPAQLDNALTKIDKAQIKALVVTPDPLFGTQRSRILEFVAKHRLPSIYPYKEFVDAGGLMSYGPSFGASYYRAATYVDKILKGARPTDIPVEQPMKFEFIVSLKAAREIGLTIPPNLLARADRVIK